MTTPSSPPSHLSFCWLSEPIRLDRALRLLFPSLSNSIVKQWITDFNVRVRDGRAKPHTKINTQDVVEIPELSPLTWPALQPSEGPELEVVWEDNNLLIINKPAGLPCHPMLPWDRDSVCQRLLPPYPFLRGVGELRAPGLLHRLDNETSGLLTFAKHPAAWEFYSKALQNQRWEKHYVCWVHGELVGEQTIESPIVHHKAGARMMVATENNSKSRGNPQDAVTIIQPGEVQTFSPDSGDPFVATQVKVRIVTGVRHQIRVHLASLGHPIVGDNLYAEGYPEFPSMLLHAMRLGLPVMSGNASIKVEQRPWFDGKSW